MESDRRSGFLFSSHFLRRSGATSRDKCSRAVALACFLLLANTSAAVGQVLSDANSARLLAAYPDQLQAIEGGTLIWRDGTRMPLDDGKGVKPLEALLGNADIEDMFAEPYPAGDGAAPPAKDSDPGRARNAAFFDKMYGDCRAGAVTPKLTRIVWLPGKKGQQLSVTTVNGVDKKLAAVSAELDKLPASFDRYLVPSEGTYACRVIAGTARISAHGHGIAIDISTKHAHYWRWVKAAPQEGSTGSIVYRNEIPMEIVRIFEAHGFIWGGKWHHYDTMHFEYRPELLPGAETAGGR
jgi:D-alanyl-D-alanine carboxypeptidase